jgi:hypothetical protein
MATKEREGSRMVLGGKEVYARRMHPPEMIKDDSGVSMPNGTAIVETMEGDYFYPNGEFVREREALETLPAQHRTKALAWWDKKFGNGGAKVGEKAVVQVVASAMSSIDKEAFPSSVTLESLSAQIASLQEQIIELKVQIVELKKKGNGRRTKHSTVRHRLNKGEASRQLGAEA